MSYQKDRDEFVAAIVAEVVDYAYQFGGDREGVNLARLILRNAVTIQRHAINNCNRLTSLAETHRAARCEEHIRIACKPWGIKPTFNGDPRGAVVKLLLPSGRYNSFGGKEDGYWVPVR